MSTPTLARPLTQDQVVAAASLYRYRRFLKVVAVSIMLAMDSSMSLLTSPLSLSSLADHKHNK
ncbi:MAG: hypothetical protein Q8P50_05355 [Bacillota bacterium]|nr:hypothetical protein [Bacillota bacterium]